MSLINIIDDEINKMLDKQIKKGKALPDIWKYIKGIPGRVKDFFQGPRNDYPPDVRKFLEQNSKNKIVKITVCREPISGILDTILNIISLGFLDRAKKYLNYDSLFHLFMFIELNNGTHFRVEKNQVIAINKSEGTSGDCMNVGTRGITPTVEEFFNNGKSYSENVIKKNFFYYDPKDNNCQIFIKSLLEGNKINDPMLDKFVVQDALSLFRKMPGYAYKLSKIITDLGASADVLLKGKGVKRIFRSIKNK